MEKILIGRQKEKALLDELMASKSPQLAAILGRRRVGKTYLVKMHCKANLVFECSGSIDGSTSSQLANFSERLTNHFNMRISMPPATWQQAFVLLQNGINTLKGKQKKVFFFDEFPWLDNHRSGFLAAFSYWWNMYGTQRTDLLVIICSSATSWMINRVVNNRGGLHNRITQRITLMPFSLAETEEYLKATNIKLTRYQVLQLYMVMGGIPLYLSQVKPGLSVDQIINATCFKKNGLLYGEFDNLYAALFTHAEKHIQLVKLLAARHTGLTRNELVAATKKINSGGGLTKALDELTESGFVLRTNPFGNKLKDAVYRLADEFTLFYFRFMAKESKQPKLWTKLMITNAFTQWCGYAFENLCFRHLDQIKEELGIGGVYTEQYGWRWKGDGQLSGAQIDLLIDRADNCINLCEIKFAAAPFVINKKYAAELWNKELAFSFKAKTRKALFTTIIAPYGAAENEYRVQRVQSTVSMDALFAK